MHRSWLPGFPFHGEPGIHFLVVVEFISTLDSGWTVPSQWNQHRRSEGQGVTAL
ncbi:MAG: hypothetical protein WKF63_02875 [Thermomicrobiales bacterium]